MRDLDVNHGSGASGRVRRKRIALALVVFVVLAGLDAVLASFQRSLWPVVVVYGVTLVALLRSRLPARIRSGVAATYLAIGIASLTITAISFPTPWAGIGPGEVIVLLAVAGRSVRHLTPVIAGSCAAMSVIAAVGLPLRESHGEIDSVAAISMVLLFLLATIVVSLGLYLRSLDNARVVAVSRTREDERRSMAAELHDFVAHHVTGILAQAQMSQMILDSGSDTDRLRGSLHTIEKSAADALASMRHTVHLLRDLETHQRPAPTGVDDLAAIADLTRRWDLPVTYRRSAAVGDDLPHAVQATAFRIVRESLTNVRKHAETATAVTVDLDIVSAELVVAIRNDAAAGHRSVDEPRTGSGVGLIGLRERVATLNGTVNAGPHHDGGWLTQARLPLPPSPRPGRPGL